MSPLGASIELGVGDILRLNRERRGLELQSVANQLRIRLAYLEAIEDGRYKDLPGSTYAVGFVRSYADYLELDGADIVRRFREEVARIHGRTRLIFPAITAEGTIPPAAILLLSIIGIGIGYGTWYYLSSTDQADIATVQEVPDRLINAPEADVAPSAGSNQGSAAAEAPPATNTAPPPPPEAGLAQPGTEPQTSGAQPSDGEGATTSSTLSTIMAPEPLPSATDGGSTETDLVPPETATGETSPATPPATTAADGGVIVQPPAAPTAAIPAPPAPATSAAPTVEPAPSTAAGANAATAPAVQPQTPTVADGATPLPAPGSDGTAAAPAPAAPDSSQTAQTGSTIPSAPTLPAAPETTDPADPQQAAAPLTATRVHINARLDTWIKITDRNGRTVFNRVLNSGEGYDVPDEAGLKMITGNAGGMDILVDGAAIAPLGEPGKVRRDVELDPEKLKAGTAIPQ